MQYVNRRVVVHCVSTVIAGHSRPKDGGLSHAYVADIHVLTASTQQRRGWPGRARP